MGEALRVVILYDLREQTYTVVGHNLRESAAEAEVVRLRGERLPAFHVAQPTAHAGGDAARCISCRVAVEAAMRSGGRRNAPDDEPEPPKSPAGALRVRRQRAPRRPTGRRGSVLKIAADL